MYTYTSIIIDDEPDSGLFLNNLLANHSSIQVTKIFEDALLALDFVVSTQPDLVFTDINMPDLNGLQILEQVNKFSPNTKVIFVSAYSGYALEALQKDAFDFICKPVSRTELSRVVHKAELALKNDKTKDKHSLETRVLLKTIEGHHYITPEEVLYLEADSNYTKLILEDGKHLLSSINLGRIHQYFPENEFVRISRKHIINKNYLSFMNFHKRFCIVSHNGEEHRLEVSVKIKDLKRELA